MSGHSEVALTHSQSHSQTQSSLVELVSAPSHSVESLASSSPSLDPEPSSPPSLDASAEPSSPPPVDAVPPSSSSSPSEDSWAPGPVRLMATCGGLLSIKYTSLLLVVVQTSALVLLLRYSRVAGSDRYFSSVAVVCAELIKAVAAFLVIVYQGGLRSAIAQVHAVVVAQPWDTLKVAVPAGIYALQNNLLFYGLSNLSVPTYQVTNQLKVFTTALFSVFMLGKVLTMRKWLALGLLFAGICLVQIDSVNSGGAPKPPVDVSSTAVPSPQASAAPEQNAVLGAAAVLCASVTSGFAGVYFEKMLKNSPASLWLRDVQLGGLGAIFGSIIAWWNDGTVIAERGIWVGWSSLVTLVVLNQALGGLLIAVVIKYADNILKGFAVSISIVLSSLVSVFLFNFSVRTFFAIGTAMVLLSTYLYEDLPGRGPLLPK